MHRFTYHYLERLFTFAPEIEAPELFRLKNHLLDLIAVTIGRLLSLETSGSAYKAALLRRMKEFVEEQLHDPAFDIGTVAEKFRVTPRYVSQLFSDEATTFNAFTRQRRLERCRRLLELSRANAPSIGEIAVTVGFGSQAYLNKAFKRSFGTTPGDYRRDFQSRSEER
jgi:AraC-like DNA-binding protein